MLTFVIKQRTLKAGAHSGTATEDAQSVNPCLFCSQLAPCVTTALNHGSSPALYRMQECVLGTIVNLRDLNAGTVALLSVWLSRPVGGLVCGCALPAISAYARTIWAFPLMPATIWGRCTILELCNCGDTCNGDASDQLPTLQGHRSVPTVYVPTVNTTALPPDPRAALLDDNRHAQGDARGCGYDHCGDVTQFMHTAKG